MTSDKNLLFVKISILTGILLTGFIMATVVKSSDVSSPYSLWIRKIVNTGYERNEYVLIKFNHIKLIKQIKCLPGEYLENIDNCFYCAENSELKANTTENPELELKGKLGCAKLFDRKGNMTNPFRYSGIIPPHYYFVMGEHKDSYDSRYIGLINAGQIEDALWPVR
jgi:type IV secretory pathway protease TraF